MFCEKCGAERTNDAAFCSSCGTNFATGAPMGAQQTSNAANLFKKAYANILGLIKAPATTASEMARASDNKTSLLLIAGQSAAGLVSFLFSIFSIYARGDGFVLEYAKGIPFGIAMFIIIVPFICNIILAGLLMMFTNVISKEKKPFASALAVVSVYTVPLSLAVVTSAVINFIFGLFLPIVGIFFTVILMAGAVFASYLLASAALKATNNCGDDKNFFILFLTFVACIVLIMIVFGASGNIIANMADDFIFSSILGI